MEAQDHYNYFEFCGEGVQATYSLTSLTGDPLLSYNDGQFEGQLSGEAIRTQQTEIGTLVTGTLEQSPDFRTVTVSLLLPAINEAGDSVQFETTAIVAIHHQNIAGPAGVHGPLVSYQFHPVEGKATRVFS
jgi:hypothetical protein